MWVADVLRVSPSNNELQYVTMVTKETCQCSQYKQAKKMSVPTQPIEGFHYDELSKIRVIEPNIAADTEELKDECKEFVDSKTFF